jgi:hypothetical protein
MKNLTLSLNYTIIFTKFNLSYFFKAKFVFLPLTSHGHGREVMLQTGIRNNAYSTNLVHE